MTLVHVPRPPQSAMNPDRPVSALLKAQVSYLHDAELKLPVRQQTNIYINAIKTEGEAAEYIREVTEAIREAHEAAAYARQGAAAVRARRAKSVDEGKPVIEIAAVADDRPVQKRAKGKDKTGTKGKAKKRS